MTVKENESRLNMHSQQIKALNTEVALTKQAVRNFTPDFFKKFERMYQSLEIDNGRTSYRTWRQEMNYTVGEIKKELAKQEIAEEKITAERKRWLFWAVTMVVSTLAGALINHFFKFIGG